MYPAATVRPGAACGHRLKGDLRELEWEKKIAKRTQSHRRDPGESETSAARTDPQRVWDRMRGLRPEGSSISGGAATTPGKPANDVYLVMLIGV